MKNEDYEYLMDNHIRNLQRLTNGKSAHENYIDFLNQRRETVDRINRLNQATINDKALQETIRQTIDQALGTPLTTLFH